MAAGKLNVQMLARPAKPYRCLHVTFPITMKCNHDTLPLGPSAETSSGALTAPISLKPLSEISCPRQFHTARFLAVFYFPMAL